MLADMSARTSATDPLQIAEIPAGGGVIGVTLCPGKKASSLGGASWDRDLDADIAVIARWGAAAAVTLIEPDEFRRLAVQGLPAAMAAAGIEWHHLPITDVAPPDERFESRWHYAWPALQARLAAGGRVLVHCRGGLGRAGTVAACMLRGLGESAEAAIASVRAVRPGAIETAEQEAWVHRYVPASFAADGLRSRQLACLLGGAIGDAVGYRVEFKRWPEIARMHGENGITLAAAAGPLLVSDDTQMTLFTLEGVARASSERDVIAQVREAYLDWFGTQRPRPGGRRPTGALAGCDVMRERRAPGTTCLSALETGGRGSPVNRINDSKGCGGVMRTAPIGFLPDACGDAAVFRLGAEAAALTHGHPDGFLPAGAMALLTRCALRGDDWADAIAGVQSLLANWAESRSTSVAILAAVTAAAAGSPSREQVQRLGEGWVGEEALAIGLYAALAASSFAGCIELAANHDGDSDSTASIAGQLYGARHGLAALPAEAVYRLDVLEPLLEAFGRPIFP